MKYRIIAPTARVRRHLMPARSGEHVTCCILVEGMDVEGMPFGEWIHVQYGSGSGFIRKEHALPVIEPSTPPE